jgi:hypothetical protein
MPVKRSGCWISFLEYNSLLVIACQYLAVGVFAIGIYQPCALQYNAIDGAHSDDRWMNAEHWNLDRSAYDWFIGCLEVTLKVVFKFAMRLPQFQFSSAIFNQRELRVGFVANLLLSLSAFGLLHAISSSTYLFQWLFWILR